MVCFRYTILLAAAAARKPGYLEEVLKLGHRRGPDVCMSSDTYRMLRDKYAIAAPPPEPPRHTWSDLIKNFATASAEWAAAGCPLAERETLEFRRLKCEGDSSSPACPHWSPSDYLGTGGCRLCGCSRAKLWMATSQCPMTPPRWPSVPPT